MSSLDSVSMLSIDKLSFIFPLDSFLSLWKSNPVPAGISLPTITFSFNPFKLSLAPLTAASVKTLVVSWKEAADIND